MPLYGLAKAAQDIYMNPARMLIWDAVLKAQGVALEPGKPQPSAPHSSARGEAFALALYLRAQCEALIEQNWLLTGGRPERATLFESFLTPLWESDLKPLLFLKPLFGNPTRTKLKTLFREAGGFAPETGNREFAAAAVRTAGSLLGTQTFSKYKMDRAFDEFDVMFGIRYRDDDGMKSHSSLRLYEGGGAGVQTSYASLLLLLKHLDLRSGARLADLGCGFGRLGLLCGAWRDDLVFFGYEYAGHRLFGAREAASRLALDSRVQFYEQDLGADGFQLPQADVFYMYDPFTGDVYEKVLKGLMHAAKYRPVTVVTKGMAGGRFALAASGWSAPEAIDAGGLSIFRSPPPRPRDRVDLLNPNER